MSRYSFYAVLFLPLHFFFSPSVSHAKDKPKAKVKPPSIAAPTRELIDNELLTGMIENLTSLKEYRLSESILKEHLNNKKKDPHALLLLSSVYSSWGKFSQSKKSLEGAITNRNPNTDRIFLDYQKALLLAQEGDTQKSLQILERLSAEPSPKVTIKVKRAIGELNSDPQKPLPPWLERKHISRRELNDAALEKLKKAQIEEQITEATKIPVNNPEPVQVAISSSQVQLGAITAVSSSGRWWPLKFTGMASINLGTSYDSNILQIPDKLAPLVSDKSGIVHSGSIQAGAGSAFGPGNLNLSAAVSSSLNANQDASSLNSFNASQNIQWTAEESSSGFSWGLTNALSGSFMNTNGYKLYNWADSGGLMLAKRLNDSLSADLSVNGGIQKFPGVEVNNENDDRNGPTLGSGLNVNATLSGYALSSGLSWNQQNAKGKNFRTNGTTLSLSASRPIPIINSQFSVNTSATRSQFPEAERARTDTQFSSGFRLGFQLKPISEKTNLSLSGAYQSSDSSLPDAAFKKYTLSAAVDHAF